MGIEAAPLVEVSQDARKSRPFRGSAYFPFYGHHKATPPLKGTMPFSFFPPGVSFFTQINKKLGKIDLKSFRERRGDSRESLEILGGIVLGFFLIFKELFADFYADFWGDFFGKF